MKLPIYYTQITVIHLNRNQRTAWRINAMLMNCLWREKKGIVNSSQQVFLHMTHILN